MDCTIFFAVGLTSKMFTRRPQLFISNLRLVTKRAVSHSRHRHPPAQWIYGPTYQSNLTLTSASKPVNASVRCISIQPTIDPADAPQPNTQQLPKPPWGSMTLISLTTLSIGYLMGVIYPPNPITQLIINSALRPTPLTQSSRPLDSDPQDITAVIEKQLHELPVVKTLSGQPDSWSSFRPFRHLDPRKMAHSLTYSTLRGPGKFAIPPLVFINQQKNEAVIVIHVGDLMCGHDGIVHGGLLATICDEGLAALAFSNLPNHIGVTASLKLNYKKPVVTNQFIVLKSWIPLDKPPNGRKVWSHGRIENLSGDVLVEAESLFVEPKLAKFISNSQIKDYMTTTG